MKLESSMRKDITIRRLAIALTLVALLGEACKPEIGRLVWIAGDSTAAETVEELSFAASARDRGDLVIPVAAIPGSALGRDLSYWTRRFASAQAVSVDATLFPLLQSLGISAPTRLPRPDVVIVSLGTNDLGEGGGTFQTWPLVDTREELDAALDAFLGALPQGVRVIWVVPSSPVSPPERRAYMAQALADARARWPRLELLTPELAWFMGRDEDGLHYTVEGEGALAKALMERLDEGAGAPAQ
jgi:lysophospholipase L1-like esterase